MTGAELEQGMEEWRKRHPQATLREIEAEMDKQVAVLRARLLERMIETSGAVAGAGDEGLRCPACGEQMAGTGQHERRLQTSGGQVIKLEREYMSCPRCGNGFFPPG
jgi:YgiT-type zinc finger domain-containing protein